MKENNLINPDINDIINEIGNYNLFQFHLYDELKDEFKDDKLIENHLFDSLTHSFTIVKESSNRFILIESFIGEYNATLNYIDFDSVLDIITEIYTKKIIFYTRNTKYLNSELLDKFKIKLVFSYYNYDLNIVSDNLMKNFNEIISLKDDNWIFN